MMAPEMGAMAAPGPEVIFARQGMSRLADRLGELGARRVLVLSAPSRRFVDLVLEGLRRFQPEVFDGARVHVPQEVVAAAAAALGEADTVVAVGGGSAIGLGKALRLEGAGARAGVGTAVNAGTGAGLRFAAIPTTYSGSEMTCIWGITRGTEKTTGRDARVRPDVVLYDVTLSATLPIGLTVQSLLNALAHPIGALSVGSLAGEDRALALRTAAALVEAIEDLLRAPGDLATRETALRAASDAGLAVDRGKGGAQHAAAHYLGGALGLDHAALHSVLLPQFIAHLGEGQPALLEELEGAVGRRGLAALAHDLLGRAGAPTSLAGLGVDPAVSARLMEARPELPGKMVRDAQIGARPGGPI
jgi:maleylacetate reductase